MNGYRHESVVVGFNHHRPQKSCQLLESAVDHPGEVLASAEQCLDYNRSTTSWVSGDERSRRRSASGQLFMQTVRPLATKETPSRFFGRTAHQLLWMGQYWMCPTPQRSSRVFGYPGSRPGTQAAFPKVRLVMLVETGTHLIVDALMCPYRIGELILC